MRYLWMAIGIALGAGVGLWLDQLVLGLIGGIALGVVLVPVLKSRA